MPNKLKLTGGLVIIVIVIVGFIYGAWSTKRWANYKFSYENQVRSTVCEMVKPEYLKKPC